MTQLGWDHLRVLLEVARTGTLLTAARRLGVDQSTVSRRLAQVEFSTGGTLFKRTRQGLSLTPRGCEVVSRVERMEAALIEIQGLTAQGQELIGCVTIASMEGVGSLLIARSVKALAEIHPQIEVHLITTSNYVDLNRREADIFVSFFEPPAASLVTHKIADIHFHLYASDDYLQGRRIEGPDDLVDDMFIGYIDDPTYLPSARWLEDIVPNARIGFRATSMFSQMYAAEEGLGIAMLPPYSRAEALGLKKIVPDKFAVVSLFISVQQDLQFLPHIRAVHDSLLAYLGETVTL
ncbi:LysR family transcriptional regulator [Nitratireductor soli]|uniref:LysR family transcriptional regulator n=1 Tax=Nitratireductor soli TaxID=1670619 RepID=UPI001FCCCA3D|nr:LysR family transcriptional regulator [Nitratireductor soli]